LSILAIARVRVALASNVGGVVGPRGYGRRVMSFEDVASRPEFTVRTVTCRHDQRGWSEVESPGAYRLVLVRHGRFRRRGAHGTEEVDPTLAYVGTPAEEEHFAHPAGGDVCTLVSVAPAFWRDVAGEASLRRSAVYIDARLDFAHRRLLRTARAGAVDDSLTEQLMGLLGEVVGQVVAGPTPVGAGPSRTDDRLVAAARRAISDGHPAADGLRPLAHLLGVSPYRLSRAFTHGLGVSVTRYRNRVRVGRALQRLEDGETSLASLAADLGFADQAHLTRTMTAYVGYPPAAVRRLLTGLG
jgi:AraC-like DNA-binding protein